MFWGRSFEFDDKTFEDITDSAGLGDINYGRGMAYSDFDLDGDLDIIVVVIDNLGAKTQFYVNETDNDNNYVQIKLEGKESNRDAFGSKIWLYADDEIFLREIYGGGASHASQHTSIAHFGLGTISTIDSVRIEWINGHIDTHYDLEINNLHTQLSPTTSAFKLMSSVYILVYMSLQNLLSVYLNR